MIEFSAYQLAQYVIEESRWEIFPLRFLFACLLLSLLIWSLIHPILAAVGEARQMHRVPCSKCAFFTNDYRLKCTVQPRIANTEEAIDCSDYHQVS